MSADDGRSPSSGSEGTDDDTGGAAGDGPVGPSSPPSRRESRGRRADAGDGGAGHSLERVLSADRGPLMVLREVGISVLTVALIGILLFALSGVWPPMVAVESGSMEPHMYRGDLVFVSEPGRYVPDGAGEGRGVVTRTEGARIDYRTFGGYGSVVVYENAGRGGPPVIHRAHFWVEEGENWYDEADPAYHDADDCAELRNCPAPHAGYITKGDGNSGYDQVLGISSPVRPEWVVGIAQVRVPYLGYVRLWLAEGRQAPLVVDRGVATDRSVAVDRGANAESVVGRSTGNRTAATVRVGAPESVTRAVGPGSAARVEPITATKGTETVG